MMISRFRNEDYTYESPIITKLPAKFYDENINKSMVVKNAWFGYRSYNSVLSRLSIETGDGWIEFRGSLCGGVQITCKLVNTCFDFNDRAYFVSAQNVSNVYHPHKGDNA